MFSTEQDDVVPKDYGGRDVELSEVHERQAGWVWLRWLAGQVFWLAVFGEWRLDYCARGDEGVKTMKVWKVE